MTSGTDHDKAINIDASNQGSVHPASDYSDCRDKQLLFHKVTSGRDKVCGGAFVCT